MIDKDKLVPIALLIIYKGNTTKYSHLLIWGFISLFFFYSSIINYVITNYKILKTSNTKLDPLT